MLTRLLASPLFSWEGRVTRRTFYRSYFPLLFSTVALETVATFTLSWPLAWLASAAAIFIAITILFLVIKRLHDAGKSGYCALLFFVPFLNLWAAYLVFFKKSVSRNTLSSPPLSASSKKVSTKFITALLLFSIVANIFSPLAMNRAYADGAFIENVGEWFGGVGKGIGDFAGGVVDTVGKGIDQVKAIAKVDIPGLGVIDLTKFNGINSILDKLPSNIDVPIPFTSFSIKYDRTKSPGENVVSNVAPFLGGVVGTLDPMKPAAGLARFIIGQAKPLFDQWVKPYIPAAIKNGAHSVLEFIKPLLHAVEDPLVKNFLLPVWEFIVGPIDDLALDIVNLFAEEVTTGIPLLGNPVSGPGSEQMKFSAPPENQLPVGILEAVDDNGVATGWAVDPDDPTRPLTVHFYVTSESGIKSNWEGEIGMPIIANLPRPDVTAVRGFEGNHGFSFVIPPQFRLSGVAYNLLMAYADDTNGKAKDRTKLGGSPKEFKTGLALVGALESVDSSGKVVGWAINPNYRNLYQYSRPIVVFYADAPHDKGGVYITSNEPYHTRNDINLTGIDVMEGSKNQIGFEEFLDGIKLRDGKQHLLYAYVKTSRDSTEKTPLAGSPKPFMMPVIYKIGFKYGYPQVARGATFAQEALDVPNVAHRMEVLFDEKVVDMNESLHGYPVNLPKDRTYITVKPEGTGQVRTVPFDIRVPADASVGTHVVRVRTYGGDASVTYDATFGMSIIPYELLSLETPDELAAGTNTEFTLAHIPPGAIFSGPNASMVLEKLTLGGELGAVVIKNFSIGAANNGSAKISFTVPYEAGRIRKGRGPVNVSLLVKPKAGASEALMQAVQIWNADYGRNFSGLTKAGKNPTLGPLCNTAPQPEISFVAATETNGWRTVTADKPFEVGSGDLFVQGKGFGCYDGLGISMTGKDGEKELNIAVTKDYTETYDGIVYPTAYKTDEHRYFKVRLTDTGWEGAFENRYGIELHSLDLWDVEHGSVEELLVTVKDTSGHSASGKLPLFTKYMLKVVPGEGAKELKPNGPMRIWWKGFPYGHKVRMTIDGESVRNILLEKGSLEIFEGRALNYLDDLSVPSWIMPGEHTLAFEDITETEAKGKVKYRAKTAFVVPGGKAKPVQNKDSTKKEPPVEEVKVIASEQKVTLSAQNVKAGASLAVTASGFAPLGTVTIMLTGPSAASVKLSGFADYTDSSGMLEKQVKIPEEVQAGAYTITVQDTLGQIAVAKLSVEAAVNAVVPAPPPVTPPKTTTEKTNTAPADDSNTAPLCPSGSTYSYTFKQCMEDKPDKLSPYDGLPCPPAGSVPDYTTRGCIP